MARGRARALGARGKAQRRVDDDDDDDDDESNPWFAPPSPDAEGSRLGAMPAAPTSNATARGGASNDDDDDDDDGGGSHPTGTNPTQLAATPARLRLLSASSRRASSRNARSSVRIRNPPNVADVSSARRRASYASSCAGRTNGVVVVVGGWSAEARRLRIFCLSLPRRRCWGARGGSCAASFSARSRGAGSTRLG